ncbi:PP2C family protein-serine/threonine phosphatase [Tropicibacter sp. S64]|uniref:PP2C family protein-serine/threonine phosphatase n=1 Tax=Tropicibacter sp. S64 TaxID=3415122 RepID=UPI003C7D6B28
MADVPADVATAIALGRRDRQEDAVLAQFADGAETGFAVLSDGMGGHDDGDLASRVIVSEVFRAMSLTGREAAPDQLTLRSRLRQAILAANRSLRDAVEAGTGQEGMGGTVVAAFVQEDRLSWISIGDSALYLYRDGTLTRLNEIHSLAPQIDLMLSRGEIDAETARAHPQRSCLTSALVGGAINRIDCPEAALDLEPGDVVLLASDGLEALRPEALRDLLERHRAAPSQAIARALMQAVERHDAPEQDNTALIVIKPRIVHAEPATSPVALRAATPAGAASMFAGLSGLCHAIIAQLTRGSAL